MDVDHQFDACIANAGMAFGDDASARLAGVDPEQRTNDDNIGQAIGEDTVCLHDVHVYLVPMFRPQGIDPSWLYASPDPPPIRAYFLLCSLCPTSFEESHILHDLIDTPPPHDQPPARSILSRPVIEGGSHTQEQRECEPIAGTVGGAKKPRKKVTLVDPRTELTTEELQAWFHSQVSTVFSPALKFQRNNYPREMARLRREAQKKKQQREAKARIEEVLWAPPNDCESLEIPLLSSFESYLLTCQSSCPRAHRSVESTRHVSYEGS